MKKNELKQLIKEVINELTDAELQKLHDDPIQISTRLSRPAWNPSKKLASRSKLVVSKEPKIRQKREIPLKLSKSEFIRLCKDTAWGAKEAVRDSPTDDFTDYEGSALRDMVADQVLHDNKVKNYLRYIIEKENPGEYLSYYPSDQECVDYMMNEVEQFM